MVEGIAVRPVATRDEARAAAELFDHVWREQRVIGTPLLWAMASHGGQVLAAFDDDRVVGAQVGVIGLVDGRPALHSHITGVLPGVQHRGVGFELKLAQRAWCLERDIERVTWTFDPMVARNAYFNLVKLGAVAVRFHRDYYGEMPDAFNRGDRTDRLEVVWELTSDRVRRALGELPGAEPEQRFFAPAMVLNHEGHPVVSREPRLGPERLLSVSVPPDYHALRESDPKTARAWRDAVGRALEEAFAVGYRATAFAKDDEHSLYLLERS